MCTNPVYHRVIVRYIQDAKRFGWSNEVYLANWPDYSFYEKYEQNIPATVLPDVDNDLDTIQYESELR